MNGSILFVCLGNICRSPVAAAVARAEFTKRGLTISVDSAGTGAWHIGHPADPRAQTSAAAAGYDLSAHRARRVEAADFARHAWLLAMDRENLAELSAHCPRQYIDRVALFLPFAGIDAPQEVPDPYYGGHADFERVVELARAGAMGLFNRLSIS
jgi:protein-tyrosine phosphatase